MVIVTLGLWSRLLARRVGKANLRRSLRYFNHVIFAAQIFIPIWFAVGVFFLGWGTFIQGLMGPIAKWSMLTPGTVIGTTPALLAWMGLWWSQYPADKALREQNLLMRLDRDLPIYTSPTFGEYVRQNFRLQILFTAIPILLIPLTRDFVMLILWPAFGISPDGGAVDGIVTLGSALGVFIIVPVVLYRILGARPLPRSALRNRMEAMCRMHGLKFRDILLWPTQDRIANALVMGVVPRFRYVLLSDLLLTEMSEEQVEAVFAHELGHVAHQHMVWYLIFMATLGLILGVVAVGLDLIQRQWLRLPDWMPMDLMMTLLGFGGFLLAFGFVSRRFERQADVFAARTIERQRMPNIVAGPAPQVIAPRRSSHVGPHGASIFASALERVALINNMPMGSQRRFEGGAMERLGCLLEYFADLSNNWLHGSISSRMRALQHMSIDPARTRHFDRRMARLYLTLLVGLVLGATVAWALKMPL